ncbi:MAG: aminotransferase class I/II-fold pyridoxal phosphate-dependent enzyme [Chitinophagales bacterium]|nr:aminotransferase class I/II-fold pyridoxal phosphate-dependent enzyme [Chitinophagales bacterium]
MSKLSRLAETLIGSEIVRLGNEIAVRVNRGEKIYNYTIGDFDPQIFPIPQELEDAIVDAYRNKQTNYPPGDGILELRQAVASFIKDREGIEYAANEVLIAGGGRPLIYSVFRAIVDAGDKVIYAVPSWNNNHYTHMNDGEHCVIEATVENDFMPTAADIEPHIKGAALLCLCTPQNPTGTTLAKAELEKICDLVLAENARRGADEKKLYLMFDQMYFTLTYGETQHYNPVSLRPEMKQYTVFVDGISKAFSATGVRLGWSLGPAHLIGKMKALLSHIGAWAPMAEQKATAKYLLQKDAVQTYLTSFKQELEDRLWAIYNGFKALKEKGYPVDAVAPQAAIYLTIKIDLKGMQAGDKQLENQADVTEYLLSEAKLAIVPFYAFGADRTSPWYRLSIGTCKKEEISEMLGMLEAALQKLMVLS